jgi:hypothetical protein
MFKWYRWWLASGVGWLIIATCLAWLGAGSLTIWSLVVSLACTLLGLYGRKED